MTDQAEFDRAVSAGYNRIPVVREVLSDLGDKFMATFSRKKREELRAQGRLRNRLDGVLSSTPSSTHSV